MAKEKAKEGAKPADFLKALGALSSDELRNVKLCDWSAERPLLPFTAFGETFYRRPPSLNDLKKARKYADGDKTGLKVYTILFGVLDADGNQVMNLADKGKVLRAPDVIDGVYNDLLRPNAGDPVRKVYYRQRTVGQRGKIEAKAAGCPYAFQAWSFIELALDADGNHLLSDADFDDLMKADAEIITGFVLTAGMTWSAKDFLA